MSALYTWYIDPKGDERSNALIAQMLGSRAYESECWEQACEDGEQRPLWKCPDHAFVNQFESMARRRQYDYDIYRREGQHGKIRIWKFGRPSRRPARDDSLARIRAVEQEAEALMGIA